MRCGQLVESYRAFWNCRLLTASSISSTLQFFPKRLELKDTSVRRTSLSVFSDPLDPRVQFFYPLEEISRLGK